MIHFKYSDKNNKSVWSIFRSTCHKSIVIDDFCTVSIDIDRGIIYLGQYSAELLITIDVYQLWAVLNRHVIMNIDVIMILRYGNIFNTLGPRQNGRHFADDTFKCIPLNENVWISIKIFLKFVPKALGPTDNKPFSEKLLTHICVTRPQWIKYRYMPHLSKLLYIQYSWSHSCRSKYWSVRHNVILCKHTVYAWYHDWWWSKCSTSQDQRWSVLTREFWFTKENVGVNITTR